MTVIYVSAGVTKRDIVEQALEQCGEAGFEFASTPEETSSMLRRLNTTMASWKGKGIDLGYNFPGYGPGSLQDLSGMPDDTVEAVVGALARARAPGIGKSLAGEANAAYAVAMQSVTAKYMTPIEMGFGRQTIRGAGNQYPDWGNFLPTDATTTSPDDDGFLVTDE